MSIGLTVGAIGLLLLSMILVLVNLVFISWSTFDLGVNIFDAFENTKSSLSTAIEYLAFAAVASVIALGIVVLLIVALVFFWEVLLFVLSYLLIGVMILVVFLSTASGILCALAASNMKQSNEFRKSSVQSAYNKAIIAAVAGMFLAGISVLGVIAYAAYAYIHRQYEYGEGKRKGQLAAQIQLGKQEKEREFELEKLRIQAGTEIETPPSSL